MHAHRIADPSHSSRLAFQVGKWIIRKRDAYFGVVTPEEAFERAPGVKRIEPYGRALRGD